MITTAAGGLGASSGGGGLAGRSEEEPGVGAAYRGGQSRGQQEVRLGARRPFPSIALGILADLCKDVQMMNV